MVAESQELMCRNHSHMKASLLGTATVANVVHLIFFVEQEFTIEMPAGEKLIRQPGSISLIPLLTEGDWSRYRLLLMEEQFVSILPVETFTPSPTGTEETK
jgi:hypothetical protein